MGTWDTGLYDDDETLDLRDDFMRVVRAPWDGDRLVAWLLDRHPYGNEPVDEYYPLVWLVLADQFWLYGIDHPRTMETALRIVAEGTDLDMKRALCMSEPNVAERARALEHLAAKWRTPNPKPRARRVLTRPQPFALDVGDCLTYPLSEGRPRNPDVGPRAEERYYADDDWSQDGWGASVVLARYRWHELFARYLMAVLRTDPATRPSLADCETASILHEGNSEDMTDRRVSAVSTTRQHLRRMHVEIVGRLSIDAAAVAAEFGQGDLSAADDEGDLYNLAGLEGEDDELTPVQDPLARYLHITP